MALDDILSAYDRAWNTTGDELRALLEKSLTNDCELIEPRGRFIGRDAIIERITGFGERFPGATSCVTTNADEHNGFARYDWEIRGEDGSLILDGMDFVERARDGRLRRVVMFFGHLDSA